MKNIVVKVSLFCLILFTFSCAKKTEYIEPPGNSFLKVKIDGVSTEFETVTAAIMDLGTKKTMQIIAGKGKTDALSFILDDYKGVGTYNLGAENMTTFSDIRTPLNSFFAIEGKLIITEATAKAISGTFEFIAEDYNDTEKIFKEGTFTIAIADPSNNPSIPVDPGNANVKAKINNVAINFIGEANLARASQPIVLNNMIINAMSDKKMLSFNISDYHGVGTYEINDQTGHMMLYSLDYSQNAGDYMAISGKITVTSSTSNSIKGTFEFTGERDNNPNDKIIVKEGTFEMSYQTVSM